MRSWKSALGGTATRKKHVGEAQAPGGRMTLAIPSNSKRPSPREFHQSPELESRCRKAGRAAVQPHLGWKASGSLHLGIRYSPSPESAALAPWPRPPSGAAGLPRGLDLGGDIQTLCHQRQKQNHVSSAASRRAPWQRVCCSSTLRWVILAQSHGLSG